MRLSRTQGRNIRTSDSSPFTLSGGSDLAEFSIVRSVGAMDPWKIVSLALTGEVTSGDAGVAGRAGQQVVITAANGTVTSLAHGAVVGIYEGNGGSGKPNIPSTAAISGFPTITLVASTGAIPLTGWEQRAASTGDVIEICTRGPTWVHSFDNSTDNTADINTGDIIGVPHGAATTNGVAAYIADHHTQHLVGRIIALEPSTSTVTTGIGQLGKVLIHT